MNAFVSMWLFSFDSKGEREREKVDFVPEPRYVCDERRKSYQMCNTPAPCRIAHHSHSHVKYTKTKKKQLNTHSACILKLYLGPMHVLYAFRAEI